MAKFHTFLFKKDQDRRQCTDVKEGTHKTGSFEVPVKLEALLISYDVYRLYRLTLFYYTISADKHSVLLFCVHSPSAETRDKK